MTPRGERPRADHPDLRVVRGGESTRRRDTVKGPSPEHPASGHPDNSRMDAAEIEEARELLAATDPVAYYKALSSLARTGHNALLEPLAYTPALEFHDPSCVVIEPRPAGTETIELYANAAYPDFPWLLERFRDPIVAERLDAVYQLTFNDASNVAVVTNHGQIIDIALVGGAMIDSMCSAGRAYGVLGESIEVEDLASRFNALISRMVTTRQAFNVPAMQVLQCGARTFLSVPQTQSRRRAKLDQAVVRANNQVMLHELDLRMSQGGQILAMAASGSQDLSVAVEMAQKLKAQWRQMRGVEPEGDTVHLQPLYDGTINLMLGCRFVLPVAVSLDPAHPALEVGALTLVRDRDDCHRVMEWIADAHQVATGLSTIYHRQEDDLLTQVRSIVKL